MIRQKMISARPRSKFAPFRLFRSEEGSTLVETGLGMTVWLAMFFGVIQCCYALYVYNWVCEAAREGSRWAIVRGSTCNADLGNSFCDSSGASATEISNYIESQGYPGLSQSNITINTSWNTASATTPRTWSTCSAKSGCNAPGNQVQVTVAYAFPLGIPFWRGVRTLNLQSTSQMVVVQ